MRGCSRGNCRIRDGSRCGTAALVSTTFILRHCDTGRRLFRRRRAFPRLARITFLQAFFMFLESPPCIGWFASGAGRGSGALLASVGTALVSPSFLLLPVIRHDSGFRCATAIARPDDLRGGSAYFRTRGVAGCFGREFSRAPARDVRSAFAGAAVLCALTVSINFYGATSLAILFPIAVWAVWVARRERKVWWRAAGICGLAYALCAAWLTPSYLKITAINLQWVAQPGTTWSRVTALTAVMVFCGASVEMGQPSA